jgi:hypothetical protein
MRMRCRLRLLPAALAMTRCLEAKRRGKLTGMIVYKLLDYH